MSFSFPHGSQEKMGHRYALFKDPGWEPVFLSAAGGLSSTQALNLGGLWKSLGIARLSTHKR